MLTQEGEASGYGNEDPGTLVFHIAKFALARQPGLEFREEASSGNGDLMLGCATDRVLASDQRSRDDLGLDLESIQCCQKAFGRGVATGIIETRTHNERRSGAANQPLEAVLQLLAAARASQAPIKKPLASLEHSVGQHAGG